MTKSESIQNLAKALCKFQGMGISVKKDSANPYFKSKYASLADILSAISKPLSDCGLAVSQMPDGKGLTTILMHSDSGEWMESTYEMPVKETNNPQAHGSSITYAKRYCLSAILSLNIGEDDDAEAATDHTASLPYMVIDSEPYHAAVRYVAEGGPMSDVYKRYRMTKDTLTDFEIDVAKWNNPENPGQKAIGKKLDKIAG